MKCLGALEGRPERADNGDLKSIQNPGNTEADNDQEMKPAPWQPVESGWDVGFDRRTAWRRGWCDRHR
jgi:hypothetical protein